MLVYIVILALIVWYVRKAIATRTGDVVIIQTPVHALDTDILLEKQPVIVQDPVHSLNKLFASAFRFLYVFRSEQTLRDKVSRLRARFTVLHNTTEDDQILRIGRADDTPLPIVVPAACVIVLPPGWYVLPDNPVAWRVVLLNDLFHFLFFT